MNILTIIGTKPQFIKASIVSRFIEDKQCITEKIIHNGQHFDDSMSALFFQQMNIHQPDYNLGINSISHGAMIGRQLEHIEDIMNHFNNISI
ncbi:MAG: UDP-N-acetyl glucosamine 2-epimerase [Ignavibacteriae bacterium]|nr:UDP-N-acetyl glucosamine 2-epimerase [Ignavibacteriota bacterium]